MKQSYNLCSGELLDTTHNNNKLTVYPFNHQVDEVAKMEEENKRIRDEIDSMERRLLFIFQCLSPVLNIFRYDRIAEFARSHGLDVAVEPHQVKLPACLTLSPGIFRWAR